MNIYRLFSAFAVALEISLRGSMVSSIETKDFSALLYLLTL